MWRPDYSSVSHQLYGDANYHLSIRAAGVGNMRENPEGFIESNTESSWLQYLNSMSIQGTWADGLIIQAVADQLNLRVFIVESHINFNQFNIIQAQSSIQSPTVIYLGHLDEYHYVSTLPCSTSDLLQNQNSQPLNSPDISHVKLDYQNVCKKKQRQSAYMKEYMTLKLSKT